LATSALASNASFLAVLERLLQASILLGSTHYVNINKLISFTTAGCPLYFVFDQIERHPNLMALQDGPKTGHLVIQSNHIF
jgi:hypothetical protein